MIERKALLLGEEHLPWFYFFASKELTNVTGYTPTQGYTYFILRARCWDTGYLPDDQAKLARWCGGQVPAEDIALVLAEHFRQAEDGHWICPELDALREQAMKTRTLKSEAGRRGGIASAAKRTAAPSTTVAAPLNDRQLREGDGYGEGDGPRTLASSNSHKVSPVNFERAGQLAKAANSTLDHLLGTAPENLGTNTSGLTAVQITANKARMAEIKSRTAP